MVRACILPTATESNTRSRFLAAMLWAGWRDQGSRTVQSVLGNRDFQTFIPVLLGGTGGARTHDRRIMRSTAPRTERSTCTDDTDHCTDGIHHAGIIWRAGPRTGPRPRLLSSFCRLLCVTLPRASLVFVWTRACPAALGQRPHVPCRGWPASGQCDRALRSQALAPLFSFGTPQGYVCRSVVRRSRSSGTRCR
jgi:hypothetical protein